MREMLGNSVQKDQGNELSIRLPFKVVVPMTILVDSVPFSLEYREFRLSKLGVGENNQSPNRLGHDARQFKFLSRASRYLRRLKCLRMV